MRMLFMLSVIVCCVINTNEGRATNQSDTVCKPGEYKVITFQRVREQNDVYGPDTVHLNGSAPRSTSWPGKNIDKEKMFLVPRILEIGDQINITGLISHNPRWVSLSLITAHNGPNGTEPDYNNIACQIYIDFNFDEGSDSIVLNTVKDGTVEKQYTGLPATALIPELQNETVNSEVSIRAHLVLNSNGAQGVDFYIGPSYVEKIYLKHSYDEIKYIVFEGAVEKVKRLDFIFA